MTAKTDEQSKGEIHAAANGQDERIFIAKTPDEKIAAIDTAMSDEQIDEAVIAVRERYTLQADMFACDSYISIAAADLSDKYGILLALRKQPPESQKEKQARYIAYCKDCIIGDIALINYIERNGSRNIFKSKEFSRTLNRLMNESNGNGHMFSDSLKRLTDSLDEAGMSRESQSRESRYSHRER